MIPVIAVDGPSGSGKGTISRLVAQKLGWHFLDSGSLYRIVALAALKQHIDLGDINSLVKLVNSINVQFITESNNRVKIILVGEDITKEIRTEKCSTAASQVAAIPEVRVALLKWQRDFRKLPGLVADGRDMGSVVFPDAQWKIFLTASKEIRAARRHKQLQDLGINVSLHDILQDLIKRDRRDEERTVAPLKPAKDAKIIDTSELSIDEVLKQVMNFHLLGSY